MRTSWLCCALLLAATVPAASAEESAGAPLARTLMPLQFFIGTWNCHGGTVGKPARAATVAFESELGGALIEEQISAPATSGRRSYGAASYYSWDPKKRVFVVAFNSQYGGAGISSAPGWVGSDLRWTDRYATDGEYGYAIFHKAGPNAWTETDYVTNKGVSKRVWAGSCTRAPA